MDLIGLTLTKLRFEICVSFDSTCVDDEVCKSKNGMKIVLKVYFVKINVKSRLRKIEDRRLLTSSRRRILDLTAE